MTLQVRTHSGDKESIIIAGLLRCEDVLACVNDDDLKLLPTPINKIAKWSLQYYRQYKKAPQSEIMVVFTNKREYEDEDKREQINELLVRGTRHKITNVQMYVDEYKQYIYWKRADALYVQIDNAIEAKDSNSFEQSIIDFRRDTTIVEETGFVVGDEDYWNDTFHNPDKANILIKWQGLQFKSLNLFLGDTFSRQRFVSFLAPPKSGKSFWLMDVGMVAWKQGLKVAYFALGDLTSDELQERFYCRMCVKPMKSMSVNRPVNIVGVNGRFQIQRRKTQMTGLMEDFTCVERKLQKLESDNFKIHDYPAGTVTVEKMHSMLTGYATKQDWKADVVIIDYADLLRWNQRQDRHTAIGNNWRDLRAMAKELNALLVTATQTNAVAYTKRIDPGKGRKRFLDISDFSESKEKGHHVDTMIGINQDAVEREEQMGRLNYVLRRKGASSIRDYVTYVGCLDLACPVVLTSDIN
jgi:replicative DNA helicase